MNTFFLQLKEQVSNPFCVFFFIAYALALVMYHLKRRRVILATKFVSDSNFALYYYMMGGIAGAMGAVIAGLGGFIQAATPDKYMRQTRYYRLAFAVILSAVAIHFATAKSTDMLPLIGIIVGRLAEMSSTPQKVRARMALTFPLWIAYNAINQYYLLLFANLTALLSLMWAIGKHHSLRGKAEPV